MMRVCASFSRFFFLRPKISIQPQNTSGVAARFIDYISAETFPLLVFDSGVSFVIFEEERSIVKDLEEDDDDE